MPLELDYEDIKIEREYLRAPHVGEAIGEFLKYSGHWLLIAGNGVIIYLRRIEILELLVKKWPGMYEETLADARKDLDWYERLFAYWNERHHSMLIAEAAWDQTMPPTRG